MAKDFLKENKIAFDEIDVLKDQRAAAEMVEKSGQMGVPVIIIHNKGKEEVVVGFDRKRLCKILQLEK